MHRIHARHRGTDTSRLTLTLPFDKRQKSRFRAQLADGGEVAVELQRGSSLRHGDLLETTEGVVVLVCASPESVSVAGTDDPLLLARAAYHLGNRHVPLQIEAGEVSYLHDHVLDDMVRMLGLHVRAERRPFEPEPGAYGHGHSHAGGHSHGHTRARIHYANTSDAPHEHPHHEHPHHEHPHHEHPHHEHPHQTPAGGSVSHGHETKP